MTTIDLTCPPPAGDLSRIIVGTGIDALSAFARPETALAVWRRDLPPGLDRWLPQATPGSLPGFRLLLRPREWPAAATVVLPPGSAGAGLLAADIGQLVDAYARVVGSARVDVRLEWVSHDACWKFHRDCVSARLLTTYLGPGTEWVPPGHGAEALALHRRYRGPLERLPTGAVALFRGSCAGDGAGIVHRSPPIAGTGVRRLLLCLNEPFAASPEPWAGVSD